jgi:single-strand DNA-binding protein
VSQTKEKRVGDSVTVVVQGRLGTDVEVRKAKSGRAISNASIAVGQRKKNAAGHWEDGETMWFKLVCFGSDLNEFSKGDKVLVNGRLAMSKWEDKEGNQRTSYEILVDGASLVAKPKPKDEGAEGVTPADSDYPE